MSRRRACAASVVLSLVVLAVAAAAFLGLRIPYSSQHGLRRLRELPPDPGDFAAIDLTRADLRALNLRNEGALLRAEASFDSLTAWPIEPWKKPVGFHPRAILEEGKNPGLGVRELHKRGITGKGIAIGIIDQDLLLSHTEYNERLRLYEVVDGFGYPQMHGAVASIAAGKSVGVAPEADIYYLAIRMDHRKCRNVADAIGRILDINSTLPEDKRIRVVSISCSWLPDEPGYQEADAAVLRAKAEGIFVLSSVVDRYYDFSYHGLGREPGRDPDDVLSYTPGAWWSKESGSWYLPDEDSARLLVPMDSRTVSSELGDEVYAFYRVGGWSWCVPYIAGMYALALQVAGDLTVDEFAKAAIDTAHYTSISLGGTETRLGPIINPVGLIERLASDE